MADSEASEQKACFKDLVENNFPKPLFSIVEPFGKLRANGKISLNPYREVITDHILSSHIFGFFR